MSCYRNDKVHGLQDVVLHEIHQLNKPRLGVIQMEVDIRLPHMAFTSCYAKQNICSEIHNHKVSNALIYFLPKYAHDQAGRKALYDDISFCPLDPHL